MRSLLALIVAVALVAGALMIRGNRGGSGPIGGDDTPLKLVCIAELRSVCEDLEGHGVQVNVEEAGVTADALAGGDAPTADGWLTLAPWRDLSAEARVRGGHAALPPQSGQPLARSPIVLVAAKERVARLEGRCRQGVDWRCIGRSAGLPWRDLGGEDTWGQFRPGFADPTTNATGLVVLGAAATDFFGTTDFSLRDMEGDAFLAWLNQLEEAGAGLGSAGSTSFAQQLQFGPGKFDIVGTTEAEARPALEKSPQRAAAFALRHPQRLAVADVVLAQLRPGDAADRLREVVEESGGTALAEAGWRVAGEQPAGDQTTPALPAQSNLPSPGVLDALRGRWKEVSG